MFSFPIPEWPARRRNARDVLRGIEGSALLEFAIALPLLVVFVVGIFDFSGAFNQKQKIEQAAQEGAIVAGAQPMSDIDSTTSNPPSLLPVATAVFNSLLGSKVIQNGACSGPAATGPSPGLTWNYTWECSGVTSTTDELVIKINRGWSVAVPGQTDLYALGTQVTVTYPYHWRFNSVIQLLVPGASYQPQTSLTEAATVHNQM